VERTGARDRGAGDRIGARDAAFHARVAAAFAALAERDPSRFRIVDTSAAPDEVTARLIEAVGDLL
jgi:dTMP kinase